MALVAQLLSYRWGDGGWVGKKKASSGSNPPVEQALRASKRNVIRNWDMFELVYGLVISLGLGVSFEKMDNHLLAPPRSIPSHPSTISMHFSPLTVLLFLFTLSSTASLPLIRDSDPHDLIPRLQFCANAPTTVAGT